MGISYHFSHDLAIYNFFYHEGHEGHEGRRGLVLNRFSGRRLRTAFRN